MPIVGMYVKEITLHCGISLKITMSSAGKYIEIVSYRVTRQDIVTDLGYRYIVIWSKCCLFLVKNALLQLHVVIF